MAPNRQLTVSPLHQTDSYISSSAIKEKNERRYTLTNSNKVNISESKTLQVSGSNVMPLPGSDERDGGDKGNQGNSGSYGNSHNTQGNSSGSSGREDKRNKPPELTKAQVTQNEEDMKVESKRIKTFNSSWPHKFLSPQALAAAGFYFVRDDIVRCPFCKIEVGRWEEEDIPKKEHRRWSGSCPFIRGIPCGNVPINDSGASCSGNSVDFSEDVAMHSYDTCGIHEEMRPFAFCDNEVPNTSSTCNLPFIQMTCGRGENSEGGSEQSKSSLEKLGVKDVRAPVHMQYSTEASRLASYTLWPVSIKQRPNALSEAGFYYTGNGDQTVCFHCGGGLKDWEEGDDPWVEHAKWFSKCHFLNLVKGSEFIAQVTGSRPALLTAEEVKGLSNQCSVAAGQETASNNAAVSVANENNAKSSPSHLKTATVEETENSKESKEVKDEGRLCKICYNAELGVVFLPCGHMVACVRCAPSLSTCPVCRQPFTHTVRAFLS